MTRMKYTCSVAMGPIDQLIDIAKTAEEVGFDSIALPDSLFYMEKQSADYPYTADGSRMWNENTPWVDPLIAAGAMGAVTSTLRFYTNVTKARFAQPSAVGPPGRLGGQPDQQPVRIRSRNRLGAGRVRVVRRAVQAARRAGRRDDRGDQASARRRHGGVPRRVLRLRPAADEPGAERTGAVLRRRPHRRRVEARGPRR